MYQRSITMSSPRVLVLSLCTAILLSSCGLLDSTDEGPNDLNGNTDLDLTDVGREWGVSIDFARLFPNGWKYDYKDSNIVTKRDNGITTVSVNLDASFDVVHEFDTLLGTQDLPQAAKLEVVNWILDRYGATIDLSTPNRLKIRADVKVKVTDQGIQEFISSKNDLSKPFTVIKYSMNVGDSWSFTDSKGVTTRRTVTYHSTTDDYPVGWWNLKVYKTESIVDGDPVLQKIVYVTNHKFGLVGIHLFTKTGKEIPLTIFPPTL
jgi:hypothetical protein